MLLLQILSHMSPLYSFNAPNDKILKVFSIFVRCALWRGLMEPRGARTVDDHFNANDAPL